MNVGTLCEDNGEKFGLHGQISNTPTESVASDIVWEEESPVLKVRGKMREANVSGENLVFSREIVCKCGQNRFSIIDTVENCAFRTEPLMLLYHFNLGYPLLNANAHLFVPTKILKPREDEAKKGSDSYNLFQEPTAGYKEQVDNHDLKTDGDGNTCAALVNDELELGVADTHLLLSGTNFAVKFDSTFLGTHYAPNLTPSGNIKDWTDGEIVRAIREGVDDTGRSVSLCHRAIFGT